MRTFAILTLLGIAALAGCLDDVDDDQDGSTIVADGYVVPEVPTVDAAAVVSDLQYYASTFGERADNLPAHEGARTWKAEQYDAAGLTTLRHHFERGIAQQNILGIKWGEVRDQWVIVGGHYDMVTTDCVVECVLRPFSQGAYDDGSGTLMTVHLAKAFAELDPYYTIVFANFDGEERGLQGSGAFAQAILEDEFTCSAQAEVDTLEEVGAIAGTTFCMDGPVSVVGMLDLDMIGLNWPGVDAPIYFDSNSQALEQYADEVRTGIGMPDDMIQYQGISLGRSDYAHFFAMGVPTAFMISDFEEWQLPADVPVTLPPLPQSAYPFWHIEDTYDTMVLMAGSEQDVIDGFQVSLDISANLIHLFSSRPDVQLDAVVA